MGPRGNPGRNGEPGIQVRTGFIRLVVFCYKPEQQLTFPFSSRLAAEYLFLLSKPSDFRDSE